MRFSIFFFVAASAALLAVDLPFCTTLPRASEDYSDPDTDSSGSLGDSPTETTPSATQRDSTPASELPTDDPAESIREDTKSAPTTTSQFEGRAAPHNPTTSSPLLPCDSYLRPYLPQYFSHCGCSFTTYSEWTTSSLRQVPTYQCTSGYVVMETQNRLVIAGTCQDETQERIAECKSLTSACLW